MKPSISVTHIQVVPNGFCCREPANGVSIDENVASNVLLYGLGYSLNPLCIMCGDSPIYRHDSRLFWESPSKFENASFASRIQ